MAIGLSADSGRLFHVKLFSFLKNPPLGQPNVMYLSIWNLHHYVYSALSRGLDRLYDQYVL